MILLVSGSSEAGTIDAAEEDLRRAVELQPALASEMDPYRAVLDRLRKGR